MLLESLAINTMSSPKPKKDFLSITQLSPNELSDMLAVAIQLKREWKKRGNPQVLQGKSLGMVFTKPSLRTRVSFEMAMLDLGGHAIYIGPDEIKLGQRESVPDVARVLARYVDCIMARVFAHSDVTTLAQWSHVPVINGLSDYEHPCQCLADLMTMIERKGSIKNLQVTYVGDSNNNVSNSLAFGVTLLGGHISFAAPLGYQIAADVVGQAQKFAALSGGSITVLEDPRSAVESADVVYTDAWYSMGQENEAAQRRRIFPPYQLNQKLLTAAKHDAIVMHDLPAHRGEEITDDVADGPQSVIFDQAENRLHAQKAVLAWVFDVA
jgi:ornithine carbamoyltransferase